MPLTTRRLLNSWPRAARAGLFGLTMALAPMSVWAESFTNPFEELETSRPPPKPAPPSSTQQKPFLEPMSGDRATRPVDGSNGGQAPVPSYAPSPSGPGWDNASPGTEPNSGAPYTPSRPGSSGPGGVAEQAIERVDLDPVAAPDGSGLPYELWGGLSVDDIEAQLAKVDVPPRSAALHNLWRRLIGSSVASPSGGAAGSARFTAMRAEVLYRSGLTKEALDVLSRDPAMSTDVMLATLQARLDIGQGRRDSGCANAARLTALPPDMPAPLKTEAILIGGYCAAVAGDLPAAGLKAGLAREASPQQTVGADALETLAAGVQPVVPKGAKLSLLDYRMFELGKTAVPAEALSSASPALLAALALDGATPADVRLQAAEAAAGVNAISPDDLAALYRSQLASSDPQAAGRRADLFRAIEAEHTPAKKTRLIRTLLDDARHSGLYWPVLIMVEPALQSLQPVPEIGWFAETAIEISLAAGRFDQARAWADLSAGLDMPQSGGGLAHWLALADLADPALSSGRSAHLGQVEQLAANGRIDANTLHRIVTVLDALEIQVPIPLWDLASRTAQPNTGFLPETGVLSQLQEASKKKEFGRTVLLSMRALGPSGGDSANLIALGDSIRALRRAGLEADARKLSLEALFAAWPRAITN